MHINVLIVNCLDLLLVDPYTVLELPSFKKSKCIVYSMGMKDVQTGMDLDRMIACNTSACFSLSNGSWISEAGMIEGRSSAGSSNSSQGWLVSGGLGADEAALVTTEYYNNSVWTNGPPLPEDAYLVVPCQVQIGQRVILTGNSGANNIHTDDQHIFIGGDDRNNATGKTYLLDFERDTVEWNDTIFGPLKIPRSHHACAEHNGKVYVMGGRNEENPAGLRSVEILDLQSRNWSDGPNLPKILNGSRALNYHGQLYVVGGSNSDGHILHLDPISDNWIKVGTTESSGSFSWLPGQMIQAKDCFPSLGMILNTAFLRETQGGKRDFAPHSGYLTKCAS